MPASLTVISSMATRRLLDEQGAAYGQRVGQQVETVAIGGVDAARRVRAGEPFDVVCLAAGVMAKLEAEGHLVTGTRLDVVRSGIAVAVRSGVSRPDIGDEDAVREAVLAAGRIAYSTGPSGDHLLGLLALWKIADEVRERLIQARPGVPVGTLLADGKADLGFQQLSELLDLPGIDLLGPLPNSIQSETVFSAGIGAHCTDRDGARDFVVYLASPETAEAKRRCGLAPA